MSLLVIDGGRGEGGGQVLRTSLALAAALGRPVRVERVRAGRPKPGLLRQHLTALRAAAEVSGGEVAGAELASGAVELRPGRVRPGDYRFTVGTAGSTTLVLHTVLLPLALAGGTSRVRIEGGTHNQSAPPFEHLTGGLLPVLSRMGLEVEARLVRPGFHPAGGGELEVTIHPVGAPRALALVERGEARPLRAEVLVSRVPASVAEREAAVLCQRLPLDPAHVTVRDVGREARGPGNSLHVALPHEHVTEVITAFGRRGLRAENVARSAAKQARAYLAATEPVGVHLADQLMLPLALLGGGSFATGALSSHARTNLETIEAFLPGALRAVEVEGGHRIEARAFQAGGGDEDEGFRAADSRRRPGRVP